MARKKIVFVIVEGPSDEEALGIIISRLYDRNVVFVQIMHGDITSKEGVKSSNVIAKLGDVIKSYASDNHYIKSDFKEIIHIADMDGAYVSKEYVIKDEYPKAVYDAEYIRTANPKGIIRRNSQKSAVLNKLCTTPKVWTIPYRIFYMSCNLDHVLHNRPNCSDEEKEKNSYLFAKQYKDNISGFLSFIRESEFSVMCAYSESWEFIKQERNSLIRHTNLGLHFND